MGEWEVQPERCADCGGFLHEKSDTPRKRIDQPLHYYKVVAPDGTMRKICPACWTTARTAPTVKEHSVA